MKNSKHYQNSKQYQIAVDQVELILRQQKLSRDETLWVLAKVIANTSSIPTIEEVVMLKGCYKPYPLAVRHLGLLHKLIDWALLEEEPETDLDGLVVVESMVHDNRQGLIELFAGGDRLAREMAGLLSLDAEECFKPYPLAVRHLGLFEKLVDRALLEVELENHFDAVLSLNPWSMTTGKGSSSCSLAATGWPGKWLGC